MKKTKRNPREGSTLDDFLKEEGILEAVNAAVAKRVIAARLAQMMKDKRVTKAVMAKRMKTSRAALDRLLDPDNQSVTLLTINRAASALGKRLIISLDDGMTQEEFAALVERFAAGANAGDGKAIAACFTPDGVYHDYIYGPHAGRQSIVDMLEKLFHRDATDYDWTFYEPAVHGDIGYAHSLSRFVSTIPEYKGREVVIDGTSRFVLKDGLIAEYHESVNGGVAQAQLGVEPARMAKVMAKWAARFRARPDVEAYAASVRARYAGR